MFKNYPKDADFFDIFDITDEQLSEILSRADECEDHGDYYPVFEYGERCGLTDEEVADVCEWFNRGEVACCL